VDISNNIQNKTTTTTILTVLFASIFLSSIINISTLTSYGARPDVGFQDGLSDCQTGTSNAINGHSNAEHHSDEYMAAYKRGLASCSNSGSNSNINQGIPGGNFVSSNEPLTQQQQPTPIAPPQQQLTTALVAPQASTTQSPVTPQPTLNGDNDSTQSNGTALDFNSICNILQTGLYDSCSQLINQDGILTPAGNTTIKCIITSAMLNVGATVLQIEPSFINNTLTNFSDLTGCGGIVKIDQLNSQLTATGNMKGIVNQLIRMIQ